MMQVRPTDGASRPFYNPERDVAYMGAHLISRAMDYLAAETMPELLRTHCRQLQVTEEKTGRFAVATARFINLVTDKDVPDVAAAFADSGLQTWEADDPHTATMVYAAIGRTLLPAVFVGMRWTSGDNHPKVHDAEALVAKALDHHAWSYAPWWVRLLSRFLPGAASRRLLTWAREIYLKDLSGRLRLWRNGESD